jgi:NSS family neurotransmitter:Na+ symporter
MSTRETFGSRLGLLATMVGLAVGLGNVWRFPYMVGQFGGGAFLVVYLAIAALVGVPALMGEWALGRHTRRGPLGAFNRVALPGASVVSWVLLGIVWFAVAYYTNAIGWVVFHAVAELGAPLGRPVDASIILPPESGFSATAMGLQLVFTSLVLLAEARVLLAGVRGGIERASKILTPILFGTLLIVIVRSVTLPNASEGIGTLMLVYGSYLAPEADIRANAALTVIGDTGAGLLAGLAIFPAVFAFGLEPASGPGLLFETLPRIFSEIPAGWVFGVLFFGGLSGAALLSGIAAYEVLVAGFTDALGWSRRRAVWTVYAGSLVLALPPMINLRIFVPWDLTFGSGGQTFGALVAVLTVGWVMRRATLLEEIGGSRSSLADRALVHWLRWVVPAAVVAASAWWLFSDVLGVADL